MMNTTNEKKAFSDPISWFKSDAYVANLLGIDEPQAHRIRMGLKAITTAQTATLRTDNILLEDQRWVQYHYLDGHSVVSP